MSEDDTKSQETDSAQSLPFEEFVRRQLALLKRQQAEFLEELRKGAFMREDNSDAHDDKATSEPSFEEYVKRQFELVFTRLDGLETSLRGEMVDRFLQLSRQIKRLDQKVDIFIQEQIAIKDEWRELRDSQQPKH